MLWALGAVVFGLAVGPESARAQDIGNALTQRTNNMIIDVGYRYPYRGQRFIPGDGFPLTLHGSYSSMLNLAPSSGLYLNGRLDSFAPRGLGVPLMGQFRVGYFANIHAWDDGARSSTREDTACGPVIGNSINCTRTRTTHNWYETPGWVSGVTYYYASYRQGFQFLGDVDPSSGRREFMYPGAAGIGVGWIETKFATFLNEMELFYWPFGWEDTDRSKWGFQYRGALLVGPVFVDLTVVLDAAMGGELSLGCGFMILP